MISSDKRQVSYSQTMQIPLTVGSKFSHPDKSLTPPRKGYFEFLNKSTIPCAIKLQVGGCDQLLELSKPSFIVMSPGSSAYADFGDNISSLFIFVIENYPMHEGNHQIETIVSKFRDFSIYKAECSEKNVLLKYKGLGFLEARQGGSLVSRVPGLASGSDKNDGASSSIIDFHTNVIHIERINSSIL